jgi:hypothetical protein
MDRPEEDDVLSEIPIEPTQGGGKWRFHAARTLLTYKTHIDIERFLTFINGKSKIQEYSVVHELGTRKVPYPHTHALIKFEKRVDTTSVRYFDFEGIHPNVRKIANNKYWEHAVKYLQKDGTPVTNIVGEVKVHPIRRVWESENIIDAVTAEGVNPKNIGGILMAFDLKPVDHGEEPVIQWRPWQRELYNEVTVKCIDDRKIIWYHDWRGDAGKTFFSKHMEKHYQAFVTTKATARDIATILHRYIKARGPPRMVFFNFVRELQDRRVYEALEEVKDGLMTATKYQGGTMNFDSPHVVVFANYQPHIENLTPNRWEIRTIDAEGMEAERHLVKRDPRYHQMQAQELKCDGYIFEKIPGPPMIPSPAPSPVVAIPPAVAPSPVRIPPPAMTPKTNLRYLQGVVPSPNRGVPPPIPSPGITPSRLAVPASPMRVPPPPVAAPFPYQAPPSSTPEQFQQLRNINATVKKAGEMSDIAARVQARGIGRRG